MTYHATTRAATITASEMTNRSRAAGPSRMTRNLLLGVFRPNLLSTSLHTDCNCRQGEIRPARQPLRHSPEVRKHVLGAL